MTTASGRPAAAAAPAHLAGRDIAGLLFVADMYGMQLDQLAAVLEVGESRARAVTASWRRARYAESARLGPGGPWIWLTRAGMAACGLPFPATTPALSRLAHLRAVAAVRLALEATSGYRAAGAFWRSERRLRARVGGRVGLREHIPDGEVHWPDGTQAVLGLVDGQGVKLGMSFAVKHVPGDPENLHWQQASRTQPRISGSFPFLAFSVLFDNTHHKIGFRHR